MKRVEMDWKYFEREGRTSMEYRFTAEEIQKAKAVMNRKPNYKVADIQRAILKGYMYTTRLIEHIERG